MLVLCNLTSKFYFVAINCISALQLFDVGLCDSKVSTRIRIHVGATLIHNLSLLNSPFPLHSILFLHYIRQPEEFLYQFHSRLKLAIVLRPLSIYPTRKNPVKMPYMPWLSDSQSTLVHSLYILVRMANESRNRRRILQRWSVTSLNTVPFAILTSFQADSSSSVVSSYSSTAPCWQWATYVLNPPFYSLQQRSFHYNLTEAISFYQVLFLIGLTLIIGLQKTLAFFARRQKLKGTAAFAAGIILILLRWPLIGFCVELYGILVLFGDFLATIASFVSTVPYVGPPIAQVLEKIGGATKRNSELPVQVGERSCVFLRCVLLVFLGLNNAESVSVFIIIITGN